MQGVIEKVSFGKRELMMSKSNYGNPNMYEKISCSKCSIPLGHLEQCTGRGQVLCNPCFRKEFKLR